MAPGGELRPLSVLLALLHLPSVAAAAAASAGAATAKKAPFPFTPDQLPSKPYPPPPPIQQSRATDNAFAHGHRQTNPDPTSVVSCGSCCFPHPLTLDSSHPFVSVDVNSPYRSDLLQDGFFGKVVNVGGVPVVGSDDVSDAALLEAALTLAKMSSLNPNLLRILVSEVVHVAVIGRSEDLTDIPRYSFLADDPNTDWDAYRGVGATRWVPATSCAEENLLCLEGDRYAVEDTCVHETAHTLAGSGGKLPTSRLINFGGNGNGDDGSLLEDLDTKLRDLYDSSVVSGGLWSDTYAARDHEELWAEGVQTYYSVNNPFGPEGGDGVHNHVWDRHTLQQYDPELVQVVERVFPADVEFGCPPTSLDECDCERMRAVCDAALGGLTAASPTVRPGTPAPTTEQPTLDPTEVPSAGPTADPTADPTVDPTEAFATPLLTTEPTSSPTLAPVQAPLTLTSIPMPFPSTLTPATNLGPTTMMIPTPDPERSSTVPPTLEPTAGPAERVGTGGNGTQEPTASGAARVSLPPSTANSSLGGDAQNVSSNEGTLSAFDGHSSGGDASSSSASCHPRENRSLASIFVRLGASIVSVLLFVIDIL